MNIVIGGTVKAAVQMENDMRDEGMGVILCANKGDDLIIKEIRHNHTLVVARSVDGYEFVCGLAEIV